MAEAHIGPERGTEHVTDAPEAAATHDVPGPPPGRHVTPEERGARDGRRVEVRPANGQWHIEEDDGEAIQSAFQDRSRAVSVARQLADERGAVLIIRDERGRIEEEQDYGTMGTLPNPEEDATGPDGVAATARAEQRTLRRG